MPIVRALGEGLAGDRITRVVAILNGTTNAVFSRMEATGCSLEEALGDARARGYAEADPSADLDGSDARAKLAILCALAFGLRVDPSHIATRSSAWIAAADFARARARGGTVRQLAHDRRRSADFQVRDQQQNPPRHAARLTGEEGQLLVCHQRPTELVPAQLGKRSHNPGAALGHLKHLRQVLRQRPTGREH